MSKLTCGVIFEKEGKILVGHVTGQEHWDIPKGKQETNELPIEAAVREVQEETGMIISKHDLYALGSHPYRRGKQICLFMYKGKEEIKAKHCREAIKDFKKKELDDFKYVDFAELATHVNDRLMRAIGRALLSNARVSGDLGW